MKRMIQHLSPLVFTFLFLMGNPDPARSGGDRFTAGKPEITCDVSQLTYTLSPTSNRYYFKGTCKISATFYTSYTAKGVFEKVRKTCAEKIEAGARKGAVKYANAQYDPWLHGWVRPTTSSKAGNIFDCTGTQSCLSGSGPFTRRLLSAKTQEAIKKLLYGKKDPPKLTYPPANFTYKDADKVTLVLIMDGGQIPSPRNWLGQGNIEVFDGGRWKHKTIAFYRFREFVGGKFSLVSNIKLPGGKYRIKAMAFHEDRGKKVIKEEVWETPWTGYVNFSVEAKPAKLTKASESHEPAFTAPKIRVIKPNGGETWAKGSSVLIRWNASGVTGKVRVVLRKGGDFLQRLTPTEGVDARDANSILGSFSWTVSGDKIVYGDDDYTIRVVSLDDTSVWDESNGTFTIGYTASPDKSPMKKSSARRSVTHTAKKKKVASAPTSVIPVIKNPLATRSLKSPAKISPRLELGLNDKLKYFVVQHKDKAGKWVLYKKYRTNRFTIGKANKYRYRAVTKRGGKSAWDHFRVLVPRRVRPVAR